jgi:hypothetical protein
VGSGGLGNTNEDKEEMMRDIMKAKEGSLKVKESEEHFDKVWYSPRPVEDLIIGQQNQY